MADTKISALPAATAGAAANEFAINEGGTSKKLTGSLLKAFVFAEDIALTGVLRPSQITADQNDYNPGGLSSTSILSLNSDAARTITGLAGGAAGRVLILRNHGGFAITLKHESSSSTGVNRFYLPNGSDFVLDSENALILTYPLAGDRWKIGAGSAPGYEPGTFALQGVLRPSQITADQDNYNPGGLASAAILSIQTDTARTITGLVGGIPGRIVIIRNEGSFPITLKHESAASTDVNRFYFTDATDVVLDWENSVMLSYPVTGGRWKAAAAYLTSSPGVASYKPGSLVVQNDQFLFQYDHVNLSGNDILLLTGNAEFLMVDPPSTSDGMVITGRGW